MTLGAALMVALFLQTVTGTGNEMGPTKVRLELRAPRDCTSRADLTRRIAARSARIEVVDAAPISAHVDIHSPHAGSVVADLVLTSPDLEQAPRRVAARSCAEAADGVAFIIAVTLDPDLKSKVAPGAADEHKPAGEGKTPSSPAPKPRSPGASPDERGTTPVATTTPERPPKAPEATQSPSPSPPLVAEPPPAVSTPSGMRRQFAASAAAQTLFGAAPDAMPGVALYFLAALDRDGPWAPAIVLGATHVWRSDLTQTGGSASFTLNAASLDACPMRFGWSHLTVRPCASALVGQLTTQGSNTDPQKPASATRPFGVAGGVISAGFGSTIEVTARLGLGVTLIRDSYELASVFYRASAITTSASVGVGLHWH